VRGKITWDRYIPFIKNLAPGSFYASEEVSISDMPGHHSHSQDTVNPVGGAFLVDGR
jgi:hypothetical protein